MRRPPGVEQATKTVPRFFVFSNLYTLFVINLTESGTIGLGGNLMKKYLSPFEIFVVARIKKIVWFCLKYLAMFLAMNDKCGFCMLDDSSEKKDE